MDNFLSLTLCNCHANLHDWHGTCEQERLSYGIVEHKGVDEGRAECLIWIDNKPVAFLSAISDPKSTSTVKRMAKDGSRLQVPCPKSVKLYNTFMGGVDLFDSRQKTYSCSRKAKNWWLRLFYFLLDMATMNAYIIHKECTTIKLPQKEFIMAVAERLISSYLSRKRLSIKSPPSGVRFQGHHFPDKQQTSHNCRMCEDRRRTISCCRDCSCDHPVPLCRGPCFKLHYTVEKLPKNGRNQLENYPRMKDRDSTSETADIFYLYAVYYCISFHKHAF